MHIPNYSFSISWSRILPLGTGQLNQNGIDFYNRIIDQCLVKNIEPWITLYNWDIQPESIYHALVRISAYGRIKKIIVTENGAAFHDELKEGRVDNFERVQYLKDHMAQVLRARQQGVPVYGYFVWTFLDNFEWAEGYRPRFGLVHVEYESQKRTVKDSGNWYRDFLKNS